MALRTDLVNQTSPSQAKVALFRSLFRGREDVYPRRFESRKTAKAGYAPACANEWVRGICERLISLFDFTEMLAACEQAIRPAGRHGQSH